MYGFLLASPATNLLPSQLKLRVTIQAGCAWEPPDVQVRTSKMVVLDEHFRSGRMSPHPAPCRGSETLDEFWLSIGYPIDKDFLTFSSWGARGRAGLERVEDGHKPVEAGRAIFAGDGA